jgi:RNA polymerase sigma-70 factor (ECF subfamily)
MTLAHSTSTDSSRYVESLASGHAEPDYDSFVDEVETLLPNLRRYARSLARNADDADDLVQDALVSALAKWQQYQRGTNLRAWLFAIIRNAFYDRMRSGRRQAEVPLLEDEHRPAPGNQEDHVRCGEVARAFRRLPSHSREVITLVVFEGMGYAQAAAVLGIRTGTVRSRLSRARSMLSSSLN